MWKFNTKGVSHFAGNRPINTLKKGEAPATAIAEASIDHQTATKGVPMDSRPPPPSGQPDLLVIAELLEAASRLVQCTGQVSDDENWPLFNVVAARLALHAGCVRMAACNIDGMEEPPDPELLADLAVAGVASSPSAKALLDHYVSVQLEGAAAALDMLHASYQHDTRSMSHRIGSALCAVAHWVETARGGIDGWVVAHARKGIC